MITFHSIERVLFVEIYIIHNVCIPGSPTCNVSLNKPSSKKNVCEKREKKENNRTMKHCFIMILKLTIYRISRRIILTIK